MASSMSTSMSSVACGGFVPASIGGSISPFGMPPASGDVASLEERVVTVGGEYFDLRYNCGKLSLTQSSNLPDGTSGRTRPPSMWSCKNSAAAASSGI